MCKKPLLRFTYITSDYKGNKLFRQDEKSFDNNACYRCSVSEIIRNYLTLSIPYSIVDTVIGDEDARITFDVYYSEGKITCRREVRVIINTLSHE